MAETTVVAATNEAPRKSLELLLESLGSDCTSSNTWVCTCLGMAGPSTKEQSKSDK